MNVVQIGANRGNDELTDILKSKQVDFILLVEPLEKFNSSLAKCYSYIKTVCIENIAITDELDKETITFYLHNQMDENLEQASLLNSHVLKHFNDKNAVTEKTVNCMTINKLFDKHNLIDIDILFIDAEGFDDRIIKDIDFGKYNINQLYYENMHIDKHMMRQYLESKNYSVQDGTSVTANNSVATKK